MKKLIAMLTVVALLLGSMLVAIPSIASDKPVYTLTTKLSDDGTKLHAKMEFTNDANGLWQATNVLSFNKEALSVDSATLTPGTVWEASQGHDVELKVYGANDTIVPEYVGMIYANFGMGDFENNYASGLLFEVTFNILDSAKNFDFAFTPYMNDTANNFYLDSSLSPAESIYEFVKVGPANGTVETTAPVTTAAPVTTVPETTAPAPEGGVVSYVLDCVLSADKTKLNATLKLADNENVGLYLTNLLLTYNKSALSIDKSTVVVSQDVWAKSEADIDVGYYELVGGFGVPAWVGDIWIYNSMKAAVNTTKNGAICTFTFDILDKDADFGIALNIVDDDEANHVAVKNGSLVPVGYTFTANVPVIEDDVTTVPETTVPAPVETTVPETTVPAPVETTVPAPVDTTAPAPVDTTAPAVDTTAPVVVDGTTAPDAETTAPVAADTTAPTKPVTPQTGDNMIFVAVIAIVAIVACGAVVVLRKKRLVK